MAEKGLAPAPILAVRDWMGHASVEETPRAEPGRAEGQGTCPGLRRDITRRYATSSSNVVYPASLQMVEGKGFEPSASGVRFQRSPGLS